MCSLALWLTSLCSFRFIKWASHFCSHLGFIRLLSYIFTAISHMLTCSVGHLWVLLKYLQNEVNRCLTQTVEQCKRGENLSSEAKKCLGWCRALPFLNFARSPLLAEKEIKNKLLNSLQVS